MHDLPQIAGVDLAPGVVLAAGRVGQITGATRHNPRARLRCRCAAHGYPRHNARQRLAPSAHSPPWTGHKTPADRCHNPRPAGSCGNPCRHHLPVVRRGHHRSLGRGHLGWHSSIAGTTVMCVRAKAWDTKRNRRDRSAQSPAKPAWRSVSGRAQRRIGQYSAFPVARRIDIATTRLIWTRYQRILAPIGTPLKECRLTLVSATVVPDRWRRCYG